MPDGGKLSAMCDSTRTEDGVSAYITATASPGHTREMAESVKKSVNRREYNGGGGLVERADVHSFLFWS